MTINEIVKTVHEKHPNVIFYGEGWTSGNVEFTKPGMTQAVMANSSKTPGFAYFSDTIRNTLKGGTFIGVTARYKTKPPVASVFPQKQSSPLHNAFHQGWECPGISLLTKYIPHQQIWLLG